LISENIKFYNELSQDIVIEADKNLLDNIFFNLFENAIKFNFKNGFFRIKSIVKNDSLNIIFENSGQQIPIESLDRIFERFYTVDKSHSRLKGGSGLGLAIVKHSVELLNGYIRAESSDDINRFILTLPI